MSDPSRETSDPTTHGAATPGRGVYARQDGSGPDRMIEDDSVDVDSGDRAFKREGGDWVAMVPWFRRSLMLIVQERWSPVSIELDPDDAIAIGRALVEMGEAMQSQQGDPRR